MDIVFGILYRFRHTSNHKCLLIIVPSNETCSLYLVVLVSYSEPLKGWWLHTFNELHQMTFDYSFEMTCGILTYLNGKTRLLFLVQ